VIHIWWPVAPGDAWTDRDSTKNMPLQSARYRCAMRLTDMANGAVVEPNAEAESRWHRAVQVMILC